MRNHKWVYKMISFVHFKITFFFFVEKTMDGNLESNSISTLDPLLGTFG